MIVRPILTGYARAWVKCRECKTVAYYDYIPHSLGNPIKTLPCGHGAALAWRDAVEYITADDAIVAITSEK